MWKMYHDPTSSERKRGRIATRSPPIGRFLGAPCAVATLARARSPSVYFRTSILQRRGRGHTRTDRTFASFRRFGVRVGRSSFAMDLKGKVALVTGGASGYGREYCIELFKQGCKVSICDINSDAGEDLLQELSSQQGKDRVIFCPCDVTDYQQYEEAFQTTISKLGGVDIVINNASVMNDRLWELEVDVNLNGVIRGLLVAFRFLGRDRGGSGGVVVNGGSSCSAHPLISLPVFTATKHAVAALTRTYGDQYHVNLTGVRVIAVCPSPAESALAADARKRLLSGEYEQAWRKDIGSTVPVKSEFVAKTMVELLKKAPSGTSWLIEDSQPPKELNLFP